MELEIKNVSHTYKNGKKALSEISTSLTPGVYGLLGPNGAGKSTLMNIITDNLRPTAGEVSLDGNVIWKNSFAGFIKLQIRLIWKNSNAYRARLGYMPQQQGLYSSFTGTRFLWYMAALKGLSHREAKTRVNELLELVNLKDAADRRIGGYSGGMKQRLLIAQALLNEPDVLVLDEPTAGLDPKERIRIRNFISEIAADKIVLLATHVVTDVECIAKEIILLKQGRILKKASPMELIREMDGLVWEFLIQPEEMAGVQKKYLVSNIMMTDAGMLVRAVGNGEQFPAERKKAAANMEDVYLYRMEADIG